MNLQVITTSGPRGISYGPGELYDLRNYGAIAGSLASANDVATAVANAQAAFAATGAPSATFYIPQGVLYQGSPILSTGEVYFVGEGPYQSTLEIPAGATAFGNIPSFAGTQIINSQPVSYGFGVAGGPYGSPVVGSTGYSLNVGDQTSGYNTCLFLHGAKAWTTLTGLAQMACEVWTYPTALSGGTLGGIIQSGGWLTSGTTYRSSCFGLLLENFGGGMYVVANITTTTGAFQFSSTPGGISLGAAHNFSFNYNGSFLDVFLDGVNIIHQAVTGTLVQQPWEGVTLGAQQSFGPQAGNLILGSFTGRLDSLRISNVARNTGTGSFTPPTAKYTFDANTLGLFNFDQDATPGSAPPGKPWIIGQAQNTNAAAGTPMLHYAHLQMSNFAPNPGFNNFGLNPNGCAQGLVSYGGAQGEMNNFLVQNANKLGIGVYSGESYAWTGSNIQTMNVTNGFGADLWAFGGPINGFSDTGSAIGISITSGNVAGMFLQPGQANAITSLIIRGGQGSQGVEIHSLGVDFEGEYPLCIGGAIIDGSVPTVLGVLWDLPVIVDNGFGNFGVPAILFDGGSPKTTVFEECSFSVENTAAKELFHQVNPTYGEFLYPVVVRNCVGVSVGPNSNITSACPWSLTPNFVIQETAQQRNNLLGFSTTDELANNLAGTFGILHGFTSGGPTFTVPEPDGRYVVNITYMGFNGATPAAGSTVPGPYTTGPNGFVMTQGTDPGSTSETLWSYTLIRTPGAPLLSSYTPAIPSTITNPLATVDPTGNFAAGVTVIPASGHCFATNISALQTVLEAGTSPTNWWSLLFLNGAELQSEVGPVTVAYDSYVSGGKLTGLLNPGPHNIALAVIYDTLTSYIDGVPSTPTINANPGTQQTPVRAGQHSGGTQTLTVATLRHEKVDTAVAQVITYEQDAGPGAQTQAAFFGDQMTTGWYSTSTNGGFATQIANNRYGTKYYWIAAAASAFLLGTTGIASTFWALWGNLQPSLAAICILAGFNDLLINGSTATSLFPVITSMVNGLAATATLTPPNQNNQAWAEFIVPTTGTATCVIAGQSFVCTFSSNSATTCANLIALISLNPTVTALVTLGTFLQDPTTGLTNMLIVAKAAGTAGNGITTSTNGANGAAWFPGPATYSALDSTITINGITLVTNFTTNATTTINNIISAIAANGTLNALVTGTLVGSTMLLTANAPGFAGNSISISCSNPAGFVWNPNIANAVSFTLTDTGISWSGGQTFLTGGYNGAIQNGVGTIVVCTVPPFGGNGLYTTAKDTQRTTLNTSIRAFTGTGVVIADVDSTLRDPAAHQNILAAYLGPDNTNPNNAGHTALYGLINPLLP